MKSYSVMRMFADGVERKRTLHEVSKEIANDNPMMVVEVISQKKGHIWTGRAKNVIYDLVPDFCKRCVQEISTDEYGVTIVMR